MPPSEDILHLRPTEGQFIIAYSIFMASAHDGLTSRSRRLRPAGFHAVRIAATKPYGNSRVSSSICTAQSPDDNCAV